MGPKLVEDKPSKFRVRRVPHGAEGDVEAELNAAADDGYQLFELYGLGNGDVLIVFKLPSAQTTPAEAGA